MRKTPLHLRSIFSVLLAVAVLAACSEDPTPGKGAKSGALPAPEVGVVVMRPTKVPFTASLAGRTVASAVSEIRPQVNGIIQKRLFKEGTRVEAGDVLYQIDDRAYRAALESARANVAKGEAAVANAQVEFDRAEELRKRNVGSQQAVDTARAALLQAQADLEGAKAAVESAQISLDNTRITAPISGIIGTTVFTEGALVTANQPAALATVRQVDPIYVDLTESSATLLRVRRMMEAGTIDRDVKSAKVHLVLEDGSTYSEVGSIVAAEGAVSETTGTVVIRTSIPNPERLLLPGMYVRATVEVGSQDAGFLVPQRAVSRNAKGQATAMFVTPEGTAELRVLQTEQSYRNAWLVRAGIEDGDRLIVDGLQRVRGGQQVKAVEVKLDAEGLVERADSERAAAD